MTRKKGKITSFYINPTICKLLKEYSDLTGLSMSDIVERMITIANPIFKKEYRLDCFGEISTRQSKLSER
ncbi:MAG: hypothetical protein AC479_06275 [miscellaneous Crenarchaeota group-6 archaeon AD8-1]|nr:MAG: hypothetical protein AC479_06275 [miscellaneous Crenarchaeota group-6 archaeon AD8-1]